MLNRAKRPTRARPFGCGVRHPHRTQQRQRQRTAALHAPVVELAINAASEVSKESNWLAGFLPGPLAAVVKQLGADLVELIKLQPSFGVLLRLSVRNWAANRPITLPDALRPASMGLNTGIRLDSCM